MEAPIQQVQVEENQTATPAVPQATETPNGSQPQDSTPAQVESGQSTSQANQGQSEFETARQIKNLMKEIRSLKQTFERSSSPQVPNMPQQPVRANYTQDDLLKNPMQTIRQMIVDGVSDVKNELPQIVQQRESEMRAQQARQEGLKLIKTNELIKRDPLGTSRMEDILLEEDDDGNSLEKYSYQNPKHAAQLALSIYQQKFGQAPKTAYAPSKGQMMSTATAQNSGGGKMTTEAEIGQIYAEIARNPDLTKDRDFMAKIDALVKKSDMESRMSK